MRAILEGLRTLLILGRVSNLPTVWSNLLAGWFLAYGEFKWHFLIPLLLGGSFLYIGGMYLNDFCDASFDAQYCHERPIPAGKISRRTVGWLAAFWFAAGLACLVPFGQKTSEFALFLLAAIVLYDFHHKNVAWAPLVMGGCRLLLYLLAASVAVWDKFPIDGGPFSPETEYSCFLRWLQVVTPGMIPAAIALGLYVAGITYLARGESRPGRPTRWALLLLLLPTALCLWIYQRQLDYALHPLSFTPFLLFCLLQIYWMAWMLVPLWRKTNPSIGRTVSGLLAGIVLVDMMAVVPLVGSYGVVLFPLFALALLLQRVVPAT